MTKKGTSGQETTMARHGTLLEFMYQRQCEISDVPVPIAFDEKGNMSDADYLVFGLLKILLGEILNEI